MSREGADAQLTVEIIRIEDESQNTSSVIASYTFPNGFSNPLDWFVEPYANIPSSFTGLLYYPTPRDACGPILDHNQRDCVAVCNETSWQALSVVIGGDNVSRIALVDDYHRCTGKKLENLQMAGFDGMITFVGDGGGNQNVNSRVYDSTDNLFVDVATLQFPVAVVSNTFAQTLIGNFTDECNTRDCQQWQPMVLVRVKGDSTRQGWIQIVIGIALVVVVAGIPLITCVVVCLCCIWCCSGGCSCKGGCCGCVDSCKDGCSWCREKCKKSGVYEVHQQQHRFLGEPAREEEETTMTRTVTRQSSRREEYLRERENSLHNLRRSEIEQETTFARSGQFKRTYETSPSNDREYTVEERESNSNSKACTICLCDFEVGEKVRVLPCDDGHIFHASCIEQWFQTNSVCPVCRTFILIPNH